MQSRYGLTSRQIEQVVATDPTEKDYCTWLAKQIKHNTIRLPEDTEKLKKQLAEFTKLKRSPKFKGDKDIQKYSPATLYQTLQDNAEAKGTKTILKEIRSGESEGAKVIYDKGDMKVYEVTKPEALMELSSNTNWCTVQESYAKAYLSNGANYVFYYQNKPYAQFDPQNSHFMDRRDESLLDSNNLFLPLVATPYLEPITKALEELPHLHRELVRDPSRVGTDSKQAFAAAISRKPAERLLPFKEGEAAIAKSALYACLYARKVLQKRFPEGELAIATDAEQSLDYAQNVLHGAFPLAEPLLAKDPERAYGYASVLRGRFLAGEAAALANDPEWAFKYASRVLHGPFAAGEAAISTSARWSYAYARMVIGGRWQLGEAAIASKGQVAGNYATEVIKGPFPEGEAAIARHDREVSALFDRWDQDLKDRWDQEAKTGGAI